MMKDIEYRRFFQSVALAATVAVAGAALPSVATAQTMSDTAAMQTTDVDDDDDTDLGWLGLLGLAGLLGLRRREQVTHVDTTTTRRP